MRRVLAIAVFPLLASGSLNAQETAGTRIATLSTTDAEVVMIDGLASDDRLNIRIKASPIGKVVGRLPNGATVRKFECEIVKGYEWCRVDAVEAEGVSGWAPARYLQSLGLEDDSAVAAVEPDAPEKISPATPPAGEPADVPVPVEPPARAPAERASVASAEPGAAEKNLSAKPAAGEPANVTTPLEAPVPEPRDPAGAVADVAVPDKAPELKPVAKVEEPPRETKTLADDAASSWSPGLEARFAGEPAAAKDAPATKDEVLAFAPALAPRVEEALEAKPAAEAVKPPQDAAAAPPPGIEARFGAPAADLAAADAVKTALLPPNEASPAPAAAEKVAEAKPAPTEVAALVPTPRPEGSADADVSGTPVAAPAPEPEAVAPVAAPVVAQVAGEIPCARYIGQPMTRCEARVARLAEGDSDITVAWPDGGTRVIRFRNGTPEGSNSRGEFRFSREGTLNMIRIGVSERFEIVDELSIGG